MTKLSDIFVTSTTNIVSTLTADRSLLNSDNNSTFLLNGTFNITAPSSLSPGIIVNLINIGSGPVSILEGSSASVTVVGDGGLAIQPGYSATLIHRTGGEWYLISGSEESVTFMLALSDETSDLETGTSKTTIRMPFPMVLTEIRGSVNTAPTGANIIVDINQGGTSILSSRLVIDAGDKTSVGSSSPYTIVNSSLTDDAEITLDIDQIGSTIAGKGLKVSLIGYRI